MAGEEEVDDEGPDETSASLESGLKSCRKLLDNYRAMLAEPATKPGEDSPAKRKPVIPR